MKMRRRFWTEHELQRLRELFPHHTSAHVAELLGRPLTSVNDKAYELGLKKTAAHLASGEAGRLQRLDARAAATRFRPGHAPWNKGKKGLHIGHSETRFKPGRHPRNWVPVGHERWCDGYLQRKVTDTGYPTRDWVPVHRLLWEAHNGPVPAGHVVVFRDRDRENIAIENLELVSRVELMRRNTVHNLPDEIKEVLNIKRAITRHINNVLKETSHG